MAVTEEEEDGGRMNEVKRGNNNRTTTSRMCGVLDVATARMVRSVGWSAKEVGVNAVQARECGVRFWVVSSWGDGVGIGGGGDGDGGV